jgi:pimeloyl-ACP methyl ester carboxylesterase
LDHLDRPISLLSVLFIKGVFSLMDKFNAWTGLGMGLLLYVLMAVMQAKRSISPLRYPLFQTMDLGFEHQEVTFSSRDGLALSGWFVPGSMSAAGRNGATVVITHGLSGNRLSGTHAARLLSKQGFAVLLYELRGHGRSQADSNTWGWVEINDLLGAVEYLRSRPDLDPERIGALFAGGQISLRRGSRRWIRPLPPKVHTLPLCLTHILSSAFGLRKLVLYPWLWIMYNFQVLLTGVPQPLGVVKETPKIAPRPLLLIAAGRGEEYLMARRLFEVAGEPKELYHVPEASHTECSRARPDEYARKLVEFFKAALAACV